MNVFEHIRSVYDRLERACDPEDSNLPALRTAVLLHEESPERLPNLLATAHISDATTIEAVITAFGEVWKCKTDDELAAYVSTHRPHLAPLLLLELAHEGRATPAMQRAAQLGNLQPLFNQWQARLGANSEHRR
ncbi:MAG: hypothetical protein ACOY0T_06395 [Myxococcota bacterium]